MNKNDLKFLVLAGCLAVSQAAVAHHDEEEGHTQEQTFAILNEEEGNTEEQTFAAGCGRGSCSSKNGRTMTPEEEQQYQEQGQGQHSCAQQSQPRPYQGRSA